MSRHHTIPSSVGTMHWGFFDATLPPVAEIASGDTVTVHCLSGGLREIDRAPHVLPEHRTIVTTLKNEGGHLLTGPVRVTGAKPGHTLRVDIIDVSLRQDWGYNYIVPLKGALPEDFPEFRHLTIPIDRARMVALLPWGDELPLKPFCGVMGVAPPPNWGRITSIAPRAHGGNLDNKELVAGATLYLPVHVEGANFSVGDGHAVQGDGEVCITALETSVSGTFRLSVLPEPLGFPRAETPTHFITMGLDEDLDDAARQALREMIALICQRSNLSREDAYTLCSLAADLRVTQLVDGNKGIHAMLDKARLRPGG
jgi:acetamidase/formamidase